MDSTRVSGENVKLLTGTGFQEPQGWFVVVAGSIVYKQGVGIGRQEQRREAAGLEPADSFAGRRIPDLNEAVAHAEHDRAAIAGEGDGLKLAFARVAEGTQPPSRGRIPNVHAMPIGRHQRLAVRREADVADTGAMAQACGAQPDDGPLWERIVETKGEHAGRFGSSAS